MGKGDISWKRQTEAGERVEVYARQTSDRWTFYFRGGRHQQWQTLSEPSFEDWSELLDAVQRRIERHLMKKEESAKLEKLIHERFGRPGTVSD
jgi:hypothetical protein